MKTHAILAGSMIATLPGGVVTTAGAIVSMDHTPTGWSVSKSGVYMTPGRQIEITGGPSKDDVIMSRNKKWQKIKYATFKPLEINIKS